MKLSLRWPASRSLARCFVPVVLVVGCHQDATAPSPVVHFLVAAGNNQQASVCAAVPVAPAVHVDLDGKPQSGVPVTFTVTAGGGSVTGGNVATGATGVATVGSWTLGTDPGTNALTATASISGSVGSVRVPASAHANAAPPNSTTSTP